MRTRFLVLLLVVNCGRFSYSNDNFKDLWKTEKLFAENLKEYILSLKKDLVDLKKRITQIKEIHSKAADRKEFLTNPLSAFLTVKRLSIDWNITSKTIQQNLHGSNYLRVLENIRGNSTYPALEDFVNDIINQHHLLNFEEIVQPSLQLSGEKLLNWDEFFIVGMKLMKTSSFSRIKEWFDVAIQKFDVHNHKNLGILEYVNEIALKNRDVNLAIKTANKILKVNPHHEKANHIKTLLESGNPEDLQLLENYGQVEYTLSPEYRVYQQLCSNKIDSKPVKLSCNYDFSGTPLDPVKLEEVNADPRIVLYHDIIHKSEYESIQEQINSNLNIKRSNVFNNGNDIGKENFLRSSNEFHIRSNEGNYFWKKMSTRISKITKLSLDDEGGMSIINYKEGNQYAPHWDFYKSHEMNSFCNYTGNRIATVLIYLSDVEEGGATVFPFLRVKVNPIKGNALVWYNLHSTGHRDWRTKHAGCSVISGSKWISTIWIHERQQLFNRPCGTDKNEWLKSQGYINFFSNFLK